MIGKQSAPISGSKSEMEDIQEDMEWEDGQSISLESCSSSVVKDTTKKATPAMSLAPAAGPVKQKKKTRQVNYHIIAPNFRGSNIL